MKKIVLLFITMFTCFAVNAQEPEKKKDSKTSNPESQERAINQAGISVKSKSQSKANAKAVETSTSSPEDKKAEEQKKEAKKPE